MALHGQGPVPLRKRGTAAGGSSARSATAPSSTRRITRLRAIHSALGTFGTKNFPVCGVAVGYTCLWLWAGGKKGNLQPARAKMATENSMASDFRLKELRSAPRGEPRIDRVLRMVFLVSSHAEIVPEILMLRSGSQLVQLPNVPPDPNPTDPIASVPTIIRPLLLTTTLLSWFFNVRLARCGRFAITTAAACEVPHMSQAHFD